MAVKALANLWTPSGNAATLEKALAREL